MNDSHRQVLESKRKQSYFDSRLLLYLLLGRHIADKHKASIILKLKQVYYLDNRPSYFLFSKMLLVSPKMDKVLREMYVNLINVLD